MKYSWEYSSPLGPIYLESDGNFLTCLAIEGQDGFQSECKNVKEDLEIFQMTREWLDEYFRGKVPWITVPLKFEGTFFQKTVWQTLLEIPYGETRSYKDIALTVSQKLEKEKMSCRAVGHAIGKNPISILIPCHRVVGTNKSLTGYNGGVDKKRKLLELEGVTL